MLKQILADMYIDPDLLAELSEEQKQILFFKMRQEQIRRWKERETATDKSSTKKPAPKKAKGKSVKWKLGADNEVWVWVMGEHTLDKPYDMICDQILAQRAQQQPKEEVSRESQALTKPSVTWSLHSPVSARDRMDAHRNDRNTGERREEEAMKVANAKERSQKQTQSVPSKTRDIHQMLADCHMRDHGFQEKKEETRRNPEDIRSAKQMSTYCEPNCGEMQESAQNSDQDNPEWQASLRKSKAADERRRSIARQARDDYRRLSLKGVQKSKRAEASKKAQDGKQGQPSHPPLPPKPKILNDEAVRKRGVQRTISSSTEEGIIRWFKEEQYPFRAGYEKSADSIAPWFHGIVTSKKAEELLSKSVPGSFLVRISEKIKGYVLSYLSVEGCKHFLIDASSDSYSFLGVDQLQHSTLADLVEYHKEEPITSLGRELLLYPCGQQDHEPDYLDLFE